MDIHKQCRDNVLNIREKNGTRTIPLLSLALCFCMLTNRLSMKMHSELSTIPTLSLMEGS
jgi:hypothetical protein